MMKTDDKADHIHGIILEDSFYKSKAKTTKLLGGAFKQSRWIRIQKVKVIIPPDMLRNDHVYVQLECRDRISRS